MTQPTKLSAEKRIVEIIKSFKSLHKKDGMNAINSETCLHECFFEDCAKVISKEFCFTEQSVPEPLEVEISEYGHPYNPKKDYWFVEINKTFKSEQEAIDWCKQKGLRIKNENR